jgi:hypothetical protein
MTPSNFRTPFVELGGRLEQAFRNAQYAEAAFSDLAAEHVERARLHESFSLLELARWALTSADFPRQQDPQARFGDPPLTLWEGRRFYVSVIVWRSSTMSIHQHGFTGAFQVLAGSSIHARYGFEPRAQVSEDLVLGRLVCHDMERLALGALRSIAEGAGGIHSLFHLEHPSVSLVVRTHNDQRFPIQYQYDPPGVAGAT